MLKADQAAFLRSFGSRKEQNERFIFFITDNKKRLQPIDFAVCKSLTNGEKEGAICTLIKMHLGSGSSIFAISGA